jgi:hypothetical protein
MMVLAGVAVAVQASVLVDRFISVQPNNQDHSKQYKVNTMQRSNRTDPRQAILCAQHAQRISGVRCITSHRFGFLSMFFTHHSKCEGLKMIHFTAEDDSLLEDVRISPAYSAELAQYA